MAGAAVGCLQGQVRRRHADIPYEQTSQRRRLAHTA